jgi:uncharacterized protein
MKSSIDLPWDRYGLIADLASKLSSKSPQFGKTVLQKIIFLLQKIYKVNLGYEFKLYTHGPFSAEVLNDLDYTQSLGGVQINYVQSGGYEISPGVENESLRDRAHNFLVDKEQILEKAIEEFGRFSAKELELHSTIIFVDQDIKQTGQSFPRERFVLLVSEIKPHFTKESIEIALDRLKRKGYVTIG